MNSKAFYMHVREMRALQKEYFRTRDHEVLKRCKVQEKIIDDEIERADRILRTLRDIPKEIDGRLLNGDWDGKFVGAKR